MAHQLRHWTISKPTLNKYLIICCVDGVSVHMYSNRPIVSGPVFTTVHILYILVSTLYGTSVHCIMVGTSMWCQSNADAVLDNHKKCWPDTHHHERVSGFTCFLFLNQYNFHVTLAQCCFSARRCWASTLTSIDRPPHHLGTLSTSCVTSGMGQVRYVTLCAPSGQIFLL